MTKRIVKFLLMKVAEIGGAIVVGYVLYMASWWLGEPDMGMPIVVYAGLRIVMGAVAIFFCGLCIIGTYEWIRWNWEKAGE